MLSPRSAVPCLSGSQAASIVIAQTSGWHKHVNRWRQLLVFLSLSACVLKGDSVYFFHIMIPGSIVNKLLLFLPFPFCPAVFFLISQWQPPELLLGNITVPRHTAFRSGPKVHLHGCEEGLLSFDKSLYLNHQNKPRERARETDERCKSENLHLFQWFGFTWSSHANKKKK